MIGSRHLLDHPLKRQIQISRGVSAAALQQKMEELRYAAEHGAVLVSPCISLGEKAIARAVMDAGRPLIVLLANGFPPCYKPPGRYFDACAEGRLLLLAPFPYQRRRRTITREQCLVLNEWAAAVARWQGAAAGTEPGSVAGAATAAAHPPAARGCRRH